MDTSEFNEKNSQSLSLLQIHAILFSLLQIHMEPGDMNSHALPSSITTNPHLMKGKCSLFSDTAEFDERNTQTHPSFLYKSIQQNLIKGLTTVFQPQIYTPKSDARNVQPSLLYKSIQQNLVQRTAATSFCPLQNLMKATCRVLSNTNPYSGI